MSASSCMRAIVSSDVFDQQAFGHFEDQLLRRRARFREDRAHLVDEVGLAELERADIDRQRHRWPARSSASQARQAWRSAQLPSGTIRPLASADRNEDVGPAPHAVGALPAHQQFGPGRTPRAGRPAAADASPVRRSPCACARSRSSISLSLRLGQHGVFEQHHPVAAAGLGAVHRGVGLAQQIVGGDAGAQTPAPRRCCRRCGAAGRAGRSGAPSALRTVSATSSAAPVAAAGSGSRPSSRTTNSSPPMRATVSLPAHRLRSARRRVREQRVAGGMAARIVDVLEIVEVEVQHGAEHGFRWRPCRPRRRGAPSAGAGSAGRSARRRTPAGGSPRPPCGAR